MSRFLSFLIVLTAVCTLRVSAEPITLYDGNLRLLPDKQGWIYLLDPVFRNQARQVAVSGAVNLNTLRSSDDHAGYFARVPLLTPHPKIPEEFNRERGYQVGFTIQLPTENHVRPDRAGFSVIATSRDLMGIELGFWTDEVFAQSVDFIHSEGNAELPFRLQNEYVDFILEIKGESYLLMANGEEILTGPLRDYSGFGTPYDITDFLFFGDDTTSASASVNIRSIWIDTELPGSEPPVVEPEPEPEPEPPLVGDEAIFMVDAEASTITISGVVLGNPLQSQAEGSLVSSFGGELHTIVSESSIAFQEGSRIDANPSGDWSPRPGGANGSAPADFGAKATVLIATAEAAARNIEFNLSSNSIELGADGNSFPVDGITVGIPEESEAAVDLAVGGFLPVNTSQSLAGLSGENASSENATMTLVDNIQTLTIPIQTEVGFRVVSPNDALLTFTGNIVATRELPEPTEPPVIVDPIPVPPIPVPPLPPVPPVVEVPDTAPTLAIGLSASGEFELRWDAVEGRSYRIEQSGNLSDWASVGDPVTADSTDGVWTSAGSEGSLFYRIQLLPAN